MTNRLTTLLHVIGYAIAFALVPFSAHTAEPAEHATPARRLDLKAPEVTRIFSLAQIDAILSRATDPALENIDVEALRLGDLPYDDNSASTGEVVFQSIVRWFAPSETYAANVNRSPDATDPYRPAEMMQANYHPSFPPPFSQR
jgi:hypothetical protein